MVQVHELKTFPDFFDAVFDGKKNFEIRKNDRDFKVGDLVNLREFIPGITDGVKPNYTGRTVFKRISYVTDFQQKAGYIVFGMSEPANVTI